MRSQKIPRNPKRRIKTIKNQIIQHLCARGRSPENVLEEIQMLHEGYGIRNIEFVDDTFTFNVKRAEEICSGIIGEGWDISWGASSRVDTLTRGLLRR
jgi:radical SAM superfamily enzyme YgiQ (UPF0313 family)